MYPAILLLIWRRPIHTKKIIESIREISPSKIYVASDGPIKNDRDNQELVRYAREIALKEIDWKCEIFINFSEVNKGCKKAVSDGISWFFEKEEEGIILEDDCLPSKDFYKFCSLLLKRYRFDQRVWAICGNGYQKNNFKNDESYFFSRYTDVWGWATWKRCWKFYDSDIKSWSMNKSCSLLNNIFEDKRELRYWNNIFDRLYFKGNPILGIINGNIYVFLTEEFHVCLL